MRLFAALVRESNQHRKVFPIFAMSCCRLCLGESSNQGGSCITDDEFCSMMNSVFSYTIFPKDFLPERVCPVCLSTVTDFYKYSKQVEANQELLLQRKQAEFECIWIENTVNEKNECLQAKADQTFQNADGDPEERSMIVEADIAERNFNDDIELVESNFHLNLEKGTLLGAHALIDHGYSTINMGILFANFIHESDESDQSNGSEYEDNIPMEPPQISKMQESLRVNDVSMKSEPIDDVEIEEQANIEIPVESEMFRESNGEAFVVSYPSEWFDQATGTKNAVALVNTLTSKEKTNSKNGPDEKVLLRQRYAPDRHGRSYSNEARLKSRQVQNSKRQCPVCKKLVSRSYLKLHITAHIVDVTRYRCDLCNKSYKFERNLVDHNKKKHDGLSDPSTQNQWYTCEHCDRSFRNLKMLLVHQYRHLSRRAKKECPVCGKFVVGSFYKAHVEGHTAEGTRFYCKLCNTSYKFEQGLLNHNAMKHTDNASRSPTFTCEICDRSFINKRRLTKHWWTHQRKECRLCKIMVPYKQFKSHYDVHHPGAPRFFCEPCNKAFSCQKSLKAHQADEHAGAIAPLTKKRNPKPKEPFVCVPCGRSFSTRAQHYSHSRYHKRKECPVCRKSVMTTTFHRHLNDHNPHGARFRCDLCDISYKFKRSLMHHNMLKHTAADDATQKESYICEVCDRSFAHERLLKTHLYDHKRSRKKECSVCQKPVPLALYTKHIKEHESAVPRFRCELCNISYKLKIYFDMHNVRMHPSDASLSEEQSYVCEQCGESFYNRLLFARHKLNHEMKECSVCGKAVKGAHFTQHMKGHAPNRPRFRCDLCNTSYKYRGSLNTHKALKHAQEDQLSQEKSYDCDQCDKTFVNEKQLKAHLFKHKRIECPVCRDTFSAYHFKVHLNAHNAEAPRFRCDLCNTSYKYKQGLNLHNAVKHAAAGSAPKSQQLYDCDQCVQSFSSQVQLMSHLLEHNRK